MTLKKSRHHNTNHTLRRICNPTQLSGEFAIPTAPVLIRRAFLLLVILCMSVGSIWGQIAYVSTGAIDSQAKVTEYNNIKNTYTIDASHYITDITTWTGDMPNNNGDHWNGNTTIAYADRWSPDPLNPTTHYKSSSLSLPKGKYALLVAGRGSAGVTLSLKVGSNHEVTMEGSGNSTKGITTSGDASFSEGTFANNNNGYGWKYFYTKFEVTADGTNVDVTVSGSSSSGGLWMSFTTPTLLTTSDNESFTDAYTFQLYDTGKYLNLTDGGAIITSTKQVLYRVKTADANKYFITDGVHYLGTSNYSDLTTTSAGKAAPTISDMSWTVTYDGYYTISFNPSAESPTYVGVANVVDNEVCKADRPQSGGTNNLWQISKSYTQTDLTKEMFKTWNSSYASATSSGSAGCSYEFGVASTLPYGDGNVNDLNYADLSQYEKLELTITSGTPRLVFNRHGTGQTTDYIEINTVSSPYVTVDGNKWIIDIEKIVNKDGYAHLNCIKGKTYSAQVTITGATLKAPQQNSSLSDLYHEWSGPEANSTITVQNPTDFVWRNNEEVASGQVVYGGDGGVPVNEYADLTPYDYLVLTYDNTKAIPRFLFNKKADGTTLVVEAEGDYMTVEGNKIILHLAKIASDNGGIAHLNCIKAPWGGSSTLYSARLENVEKPVTISKTIAIGNDQTIRLDGNLMSDHIPYNYIRIELVNGSTNKELYALRNGLPKGVSTFKVESSFGDKQGDYLNVNGENKIYVCSSLGYWYDGLLVSGGNFVFTLPDRTGLAGNHLKIYLARFSDSTYGVNTETETYNEPDIEKIYDYELWMAGDETKPQVHQKYVDIDVDHPASVFDVSLDAAEIQNYYNKSLNQFQNFYIRWYVADKVTHQPIADENGNPISLASVLSNVGTYTNNVFNREDVGLIWYLNNNYVDGHNVGSIMENQTADILGVHVELPNGLTQNDVELVALTTIDFDESGINIEPKNLQHKFVVNFVKSGESVYMDLPFRHYKGITGREWERPNGSDSPNKMTQDIWTIDGSYNNLLPTSTTNDPEKRNLVQGSIIPTNVSSVEDDIRQGVHTWEYNIYITPDDRQRALILPFENYMYSYDTNIKNEGNDLEPRAYFRWYDWDTDLAVVPTQKNYTFTACNPNILKSFTETINEVTRDRGLIALNIDPTYPTQGRVGVWLQVDDQFDDNFETNFPNGFNIACDVSKYNDGIRIFGTNAYLEHEPTLSERYIFHIYPGKKIADELADARANLSAARELLEDPSLTDNDEKRALYTKLEYLGTTDGQGNVIKPMFDLPENEGRMVVSLGAGKSGSFSLRLDETLLQNYKLWNGDKTALVDADHVKWVAFYEDAETGMVMRKQLVEPNTSRIQTFTYDNFKGYYYPLGSTTASESVQDGMKFHVVGYVTSSDVNTLTGTGIYAPVTHYEVQFLVAPPLPVVKLKSNADNVRTDNIERTDEYMVQHYDLQAVVDFDGNAETNKNITAEPERENYFFSKLNGSGVLDNSKNWYNAPSARENNMSWMPRKWTDIEYSYCYPQLCDYVIDSNTGYWVYNRFLSPRHGDYMILKSMNKPNVSDQRQGYPYELQWWWGTELYDYTNVYTDQNKYGSFLYTDASDESRTMITIPFKAELCGGSSIYVTAAVADMTNSETKPQLLIRIVGIDDEGNQVRVVSFHTCDISTTGASTGEWYQIYGESTIPATFDDEIKNFVCEVVNYASNTRGADFAIDQLQVYTSTAKVKLSQTEGGCNDPSNKMFVYSDAEGLQALFGRTGKTNIYWRIHDEHGEVVMKKNMYDDDDSKGEHIYGMIENLDLDYTKYLKQEDPVTHETNVVTEQMVKDNDNLYWFMGDDHKVYCKIAYRHLSGLLDGQTYYVSIYDPGRTLIGDFHPENNSYWGGLHTAARSKCSVFSPDFVPRQQFVIYYNNTGSESMEGGYIWMNNCDDAPIVSDMSMKLKKPDLSQPSGFANVDADLHYDYFFGTIAQWQTDNPDETFTYLGTQYSFMNLSAAYQRYRSDYPTASELPADYINTDDGKILKAAVDANLLELGYKTTFSNNFNTRPSKDFTVVCLAIEDYIPETGIAVCSPFVVKFDIVWHKPEMELGFSDVEYPRREGLHRIVRIGLEQLNNLRNKGYMLHIPIHDFKNKKKEDNTGTIYFYDNKLQLVETDDPTIADLSQNALYIATLTSPHSGHEIHNDNAFVDADHMFLPLNFSGTNCQISFHEGYSYKAHTIFYDYADEDNFAAACKEDMYLTIKVVPEYVTWDPQALGPQTAGGVDYYNVNWNNDANWNRSERAELYMDNGDTPQQNTPTTWRQTVQEGGTYYYGDKYYKNDEDINSSLSSEKAFVPMKFTYVTLPKNCHAPSLINMDLVAYNTSPYTGGAILAGNLITDPSPNDPERKVNSPATSEILYDILVRYSENTCQGHLQSDGTVYTLGGANDKVYDCEKFYGNICKEIYFKPGAELINQQRMTYEKAWVEKELEPNKWYLMSAPLKATYAGDMYVPVTMNDLSMATPANKTGRQMTEAFQPITFSTTAKAATATTTSQPAYSRTKYPFYQHSWDHGTGTNGSIVYTETTDPRQQYYDADLRYADALTSTFAQWSHVFNDVQVAYSQMQGFAIRAHKRSGAADERALLRLPKADTGWDYYNYKDIQGMLNQSVTKGNLNYGRFVTEDSEGKPYDNKATMSVSLVQPNENTSNQYFLVGNPYMASLDMTKFFEANTHLGTAWWTIDGNPTTGLNSGRVRPLEAFFVKTTSPSTPVKFVNDMMVDGNDGTQPSSSRPYVMLKARTGGVTSTATLEFSDNTSAEYVEGEDVETLFDSNLADVPMVYTVAADGMAVSINQLPELTVVPFGVTCNNNGLVEVTITNNRGSISNNGLFVFDAMTGTTTAVNDGESMSIQPNDYGRYYLTIHSSLNDMKSDVTDGIVISLRDGMVSVKAKSNISLVNVVSVSGAKVHTETNCGTETQFTLPQGTYAIEAICAESKRTAKIIVK